MHELPNKREGKFMQILNQLLSLILLILLVAVPIAEAQLINYQRRNEQLQDARQSRQSTTTTTQSSEKSVKPAKQLPMWMRVIPPAKTKEEVRYDVNRDGQLQSAEVKILLRDTVNMVESKGAVKIESEVLKEYDEDKDGLIERREVDRIKSDVAN
jgi:hypothetical protein